MKSLFIITLALVLSGCVQPGMQEDLSQFGDSLIAREVLPATYSERGDTTDRELEAWVSQQCTIRDAPSARHCAIHIGMTCNDMSAPEVECVFVGTRRSRAVQFLLSPSSPSSVGEWRSGEAKVLLFYSAPGPVRIDYSATPVSEAKQK